ncbi:hypothetical protein E3N88_12256 [Mikania micrantha]|uniref:Uncharacterized protein n=2 Tax=Mikania micrantha TaxID=192012 RepID=A0A5N6P6B0_9ASTR|nr:hypothetical protein E3N88_12256 [Mikania micrantha]
MASHGAGFVGPVVEEPSPEVSNDHRKNWNTAIQWMFFSCSTVEGCNVAEIGDSCELDDEGLHLNTKVGTGWSGLEVRCRASDDLRWMKHNGDEEVRLLFSVLCVRVATGDTYVLMLGLSLVAGAWSLRRNKDTDESFSPENIDTKGSVQVDTFDNKVLFKNEFNRQIGRDGDEM